MRPAQESDVKQLVRAELPADALQGSRGGHAVPLCRGRAGTRRPHLRTREFTDA